MAIFKTPEEKAAARERKAQDAYLRSPTGRAETARSRGDALLQVVLRVDDDTSKTLSDIEALGWRLETADHVYEPDFSSVVRLDDQVSTISASATLRGVYLFRRS